MFWSFFVSCSHLQLGMRKTTITFNAVITACEKAARWQARACLFAELTQPCLSHHPECSDNFINCWTTSHNTRVFTSIAPECFFSQRKTYCIYFQCLDQSQCSILHRHVSCRLCMSLRGGVEAIFICTARCGQLQRCH